VCKRDESKRLPLQDMSDRMDSIKFIFFNANFIVIIEYLPTESWKYNR
jgi:hypothetical protein